MNVLIIGSGGREHALAWKIAQSPLLEQLYTMPGNPGTATVGQNIEGDIFDFEGIEKFVEEHEVDTIIVGPEAPLVAGIADYFKDKNVNVVGPTKAGAELEGSKAFAKSFMKEFNIPTAGYVEVTQSNVQEGLDYISNNAGPYVLKADGLAAGKGVLIIEDREEAKGELSNMINGKFGEASSKVVIEEFLDGIEFSVFVLTDGERYKILPEAKDYKRIGEGDTGLNTGGMGAVSPVSFVDAKMMKIVENEIVIPTIKGLQTRKIDYKGFIFLGLISVDGQPKVIEYNCRMGDPETEVVMPRIESDILPVIQALGTDAFDNLSIEVNPDYATTVMLVSGGYPEAYQKGKTITIPDEVSGSIVFHAGTKEVDDQLITNGGRVIAVTSYGEDKDEAINKSLSNASKIIFEGVNYRKDIGFDVE